MTVTPLDEGLLDEASTYGSRINEVLHAFTPVGDFKASDVTDRAFAYLQDEEPELLAGWMDEVARQVLRSHFRAHLLRQRATWRATAQRRAFRNVVNEAEETGDSTSLSDFSFSYVVNEESLRRRVGEMTADDHSFVASVHERSADRLLLLAAFHRAIAKRIPPGKTTADVMDEETYSRIFRSIAT